VQKPAISGQTGRKGLTESRHEVSFVRRRFRGVLRGAIPLSLRRSEWARCNDGPVSGESLRGAAAACRCPRCIRA
jgi:hypothetical protein